MLTADQDRTTFERRDRMLGWLESTVLALVIAAVGVWVGMVIR